MTSDIRTVRHIESAVRGRANCVQDSQERYPGFTNECPVAWRMEMLERLRTLNVCSFQSAMPTSSKLPQGDLEPDGTLEADPIEQYVQRSVDAGLTPASVVCSYLDISTSYSYSSYTHRRQRQRYPGATENPMNPVP